MRKLTMMLVAIISLVPGTVIAQAMDATAKQSQWWEVAAGVLAIPAAFLGLGYSYLLIRKTRLEARKTELEIVEKERVLKALMPSQSEAAKDFVRPLIEGRQSQLLVLRFVLLYVVLKLWGLVESALGLVFGGALFGAHKVFGFDLVSPWILIPAFALGKLPEVVTWIIVIGIGWPLFRDLNTFLNLDLKSILLPWRK